MEPHWMPAASEQLMFKSVFTTLTILERLGERNLTKNIKEMLMHQWRRSRGEAGGHSAPHTFSNTLKVPLFNTKKCPFSYLKRAFFLT